MYKGIVFDLDGTLVDSPLCFRSIREELEIPEGHYILEYLDPLPAATKEAKLRRLEEIEVEAARRSTPFPGVQRLLGDLRAKGILTGILTRNCRAATGQAIGLHQMAIDLIVTREDAPAKPDPSGLRKFLAEWSLAAEELLFVGDVHFDIECGKRAGVRTALFTNGGDGRSDLLPDHIFADYAGFWGGILSK